MAAYKRLYIDVETNNVRSTSAAIARNLIALLEGATLGEVRRFFKTFSGVFLFIMSHSR